MERRDDKRLSDEEFKVLLSQALHIVQRPVGEYTEDELDILSTIVSNSQFFQRNLDSKINFDDFMQHAKSSIDYESYPRGSIIFHEGQYANKISIILKGSAVRFHQRPLREVEEEAHERHKQIMKEKEEEEYLAKKANAYEAIQQVSLTQLDNLPSARRAHRASTSMTKLKLNKGLSKLEEELRGSPKRPGVLVAATFENLYSESDDMREEMEDSGNEESGSLGYLNDTSRSRDDKRAKTMMIKSPFNLVRQDSFGKGKSQNSMKRKEDRKLTKKQVLEEPKIKELNEAAEFEHEGETGDYHKKIEIRKFKESAAKEEDIKLFQEIVKKNPKITTKYFVGDIFKLRRAREYQMGSHFGESFLKRNKGKENLLVVQEEIHLLSISKESYLNVINQLYDNVKEKMNFFAKVFSYLEDSLSSNFAYYFKEKVYQKAEKIYLEDDVADNLFLLKSGNVRLFKKAEPPAVKQKSLQVDAVPNIPHRSPKSEIPVTSVVEGNFFGEELLLKEEKRQYTAISRTSGTKVYYLEGWVYQKIKGVFTNLLNGLRTQALEKLNWRQMRVEDMIDNATNNKPQAPQERRTVIMPEIKDRPLFIASENNSPRLRMNGSMQDLPVGLFNRIEGVNLSPEGKRGSQYSILPARSSIVEDEIITGNESPVGKNLAHYKGKYYRKNFTNKIQVESYLKKAEEDSPVKNPFALNKDIDTIYTGKRAEVKQLSCSISQLPLSSLMDRTRSPGSGFKDTRDIVRSGREGSLQFLDSCRDMSQPSMQNLKTVRSNVIKFLAPQYQEGTDEVIKATNGSIFVVSGRSKLRGILKTLEHVPDLCSALNSPKNKEKTMMMPTLRKSPTTPKLKTIGKIHKVSGLLKSPETSPTKYKPEPLNVGLLSQKLNLVTLKKSNVK